MNRFFDDRLQYFMHLYHTRSWRKAAKIIPITYQGLRKSIASFECSLGCKLFEESESNTIVPTTAADHLYEQACAWSKESARLEQELNALKDNQRRVVRVGAAMGAPTLFPVDISARFAQDHPSLLFEFEEYPDTIIDSALKEGEYDIALVTAPYNASIVAQTLFRVPLHFWVNKANPLAHKECLSSQDVKEQSIFTVDVDSKIISTIRAFLDVWGIPQDHLFLLSEFFLVYACALENKGLCIAPKHYVDLMSSAADVVGIPPDKPIATWKVGIASRKGYPLSPDEKAVVDYLIAYAQP